MPLLVVVMLVVLVVVTVVVGFDVSGFARVFTTDVRGCGDFSESFVVVGDDNTFFIVG